MSYESNEMVDGMGFQPIDPQNAACSSCTIVLRSLAVGAEDTAWMEQQTRSGDQRKGTRENQPTRTP